MDFTLTNIRGAVDLALAFQCFDFDEIQRLKEAFRSISLPRSGVDFISFGLDELQPEAHFAEGHGRNPKSYWVECGVDKTRFLSPPDPKALRDYILDFVERSLQNIQLPPSDKAPLLQAFREWRTSTMNSANSNHDDSPSA